MPQPQHHLVLTLTALSATIAEYDLLAPDDGPIDADSSVSLSISHERWVDLGRPVRLFAAVTDDQGRHTDAAQEPDYGPPTDEALDAAAVMLRDCVALAAPLDLVHRRETSSGGVVGLSTDQPAAGLVLLRTCHVGKNDVHAHGYLPLNRQDATDLARALNSL